VRQFLIHAALKRADELNRLRELPDTPTRTEEPPPIVAGLSSDRSDADPGTITETPVVSIPIEIGEPSPVELPTAAPQASPKVDAPAVKKAEPAKPQRDAGRRVYRVRHTKVAAKPPQPRQYSFLEMFFWGPPYQQSTYSNKPQKSQLDQSTDYAQQQYQQPAYAQQAARQQYYYRADEPANLFHNSPRYSLLARRRIPALSSSRASCRNSRTIRSRRFAFGPRADFAAS